MIRLNKLQRLALLAAAMVVGLGTATVIYEEGFSGALWILGVLITTALLIVASVSHRQSHVGEQPEALLSPSQRPDNGTTIDRAWIIAARNSVEGIASEYSVMSKIFGRPQIDWTISSRRLIQNNDRTVEYFVLSTKNGRKEIFFDVTSFISNNQSLSDAIPEELRNSPLNRPVLIRFMPQAAADLQGFLSATERNPKLKLFLDERDVIEIKSALDRAVTSEQHSIVSLHTFTAIKLGAFLDMFRKGTKDLEIQDWIDNCTGAIRYGLKSN